MQNHMMDTYCARGVYSVIMGQFLTGLLPIHSLFYSYCHFMARCDVYLMILLDTLK